MVFLPVDYIGILVFLQQIYVQDCFLAPSHVYNNNNTMLWYSFFSFDNPVSVSLRAPRLIWRLVPTEHDMVWYSCDLNKIQMAEITSIICKTKKIAEINFCTYLYPFFSQTYHFMHVYKQSPPAGSYRSGRIHGLHDELSMHKHVA